MRTIFLNILILLSSSIYAQDFGYFGKKNSISMSGTFSPRFIANLLNRNEGRDYYMNYEGTNAKAWPVSYGGTISYERQVRSNKFIGIEFSYTNTASRYKEAMTQYILKTDTYGYYYNELSIRTSNIAPLRINVYNPTFTISKVYSGNIAPIGLVNTIGFGLLIAKPVKKDYDADFEIYSYDYGQDEAIDVNLEELKSKIFEPEIFDKTTWGARFYWQTALNIPLSKNILWSFAVKGNLNIYFPLLYSISDNSSNSAINRSNINRAFSQAELLNILELKTGLKFAF